MKKALILAAAALFLSAPLVAQQVKVDRNSYLKKIEKSDADIANPKKADKAATWLTRGKLFYDAETAISNNIFGTMTEDVATQLFGNPTAKEDVVIGNKPVTKITYPYLIAYLDANGIMAWETTYVIYDNAIDKAIEAYNKAYELDKSAKNAESVKQGLKASYDELYKTGSVYFTLNKYDKAAEYFERTYVVSQYPGFAGSETTEAIASLAYDTGIAYLFSPDYAKSLHYLKIAETSGTYKEGDVYYLMYHAYKGLAPNNEPAVLEEAKAMLMRGLQKFPENANIIECLTDVYVALGDEPNALVPVVEAAIAADPTNVSLWNGLGRIYEKLGNTDKAIESFEHVAELMPNNPNAHFSVGILYVRKGDNMSEQVNTDSSIATQAQYDAAMENANAVYRTSIAPLEKAYELDNGGEITPIALELLKNVTFRLREEPGMTEKNVKYTEALKALQQ